MFPCGSSGCELPWVSYGPEPIGGHPTFCERGRACLTHGKSTGSRFAEPREYTPMGVDCWVVCGGLPLQYTPTFCEQAGQSRS